MEQLVHVPEGIQVVISRRVDPPLPLSRWRGRGQLAELRAADLRFSDAEASALLERMQLVVGTDDVARLVERTEGWAAGLSLAGLSIGAATTRATSCRSSRGRTGTCSITSAPRCWMGLAPDAQRFLVQASVLQRLSGPLCDAILERRGSGLLLQELDRANAFVVRLGGTRSDPASSPLRRGACRASCGASTPAWSRFCTAGRAAGSPSTA